MSRRSRSASPLSAFVTARPQAPLPPLPPTPPAARPPEAASRGVEPRAPERGNLSVWLPLDLQARARACAYWERLTLSRLVEEALTAALDGYEERRGSPYEPAPARLPAGRPLGRR